jgi:SSS family solute:Na+ symporter
VALNGAALMLFAFLPVLLGMAGRVALPATSSPDLVLPAVMTQLLPAWLGALALAAVFSTEVDTCDAILFMISTSVSRDLFQGYVRPGATDRELLLVARVAAVAGGVLGVLLSIYLSTIVQAMTVFYSLLGVSLFVPVLGGLCSRRAGPAHALAAIVAGVVVLLVVRFGVAGRYPWLDPTLSGLIAAAVAFVVTMIFTRRAGLAL